MHVRPLGLLKALFQKDFNLLLATAAIRWPEGTFRIKT
jgi:hypothetical protein